MSQEKNLLHLCENCLQELRRSLGPAPSSESSPLLNQKLFLLETALEEFQKDHVDFESVCHRLNTPLCIADQEGKHLYVNPAFVGFSSSAEVQVELLLTQVLQTGRPIQTQIPLEDSKTAYIIGSPILDQWGRIQYAALQVFTQPDPCRNSNTHTNPDSPPATPAVPYRPYLEEGGHSLKKAVEGFERDILTDTIAACGSKRKAAAALHMDHSTLIKKCQRYGI